MKIILLAGPTASGKSRLALEIAAKHDGVIVNADSMQVYGELRVLTARPSAEDEASAPHRLYGHVPAADALFGRSLARRYRGRCWRRCARRGACRSSSAAPASISRR